MRTNITNLSRQNLDIVLEYHNSPLVFYSCKLILAEEIDLIGHFRQLSDLRDLDLGSSHMAYRRVSLIGLYLHTNFVEIEKKILDGRAPDNETVFIRSTRKRQSIAVVNINK